MTDINMQSANPAFLHDPSNLLNAPKQRKSKEKSCERHRRMKQRCPVECPDRPEKLVKQFVPPTLAPIMSMKVAPPQFAVAVPFQVPMVDSKVKCSNAGLGCQWEGSNADLHTHLGKCDYQMFPCRWKCHGVYTRKDLMGHEEICDLKLPLCMKCSSPVKIGDLEKHETECPMVTVECPKKCGVSILRGRESAHATDCPLQLTRCLHNDRGCNVQLLRKDMKDHLKECSYETFKSLFSRIDALEQKVAQQFDKIQEQNLRIIQLDLKVGQQERTIKSQQEVIAKLKEPTSSDSPVAMQPDEGKIELVDPYVNSLKRNHEKPKKGPKKTQSAYMFFCSEKRKEISAKNPYMKMVDVVKELSKMWNECSDRKKYEEMAAKDKERYEKEKMMMNAGQDVMSEEDSASSSSDSLIFEENEEVERSPKRSNIAN